MDDRDQWDLSPDAVEMALTFLAPHSAGAIVREAFYGTRRFDDFVARTGLTRSAVASRLRHLVDNDILHKVAYQEPGDRQRFEYALSPRGTDLATVVLALMGWAQRWLPEATPPTVDIRHATCGGRAAAGLRCEHGHDLPVADLVARPGPGARRR